MILTGQPIKSPARPSRPLLAGYHRTRNGELTAWVFWILIYRPINNIRFNFPELYVNNKTIFFIKQVKALQKNIIYLTIYIVYI